MKDVTEKVAVIAQVCERLSDRDLEGAKGILDGQYRFERSTAAKRRATVHQMLDTFVRDGFIDRYSGSRLLFPGVLFVLSERLPDAFPRHPNWKYGETHSAYWELMPTLDHRIPLARGGEDGPANWLTTSMARNAAKANWTVGELNWNIHPAGELHDWDGQMGWFRAYVAQNPDLLQHERIKRWEWAARHHASRSRGW